MKLSKSTVSRMAAVACITVLGLGSGVAAQASTASPQIGGTTGCPGSGYIEDYFTCTSLSNGVLQHYKYTNDKVETAYYKKAGSASTLKIGYGKGSTRVYAGTVTLSSGQSTDTSWGGVAYCTDTIGVMSSDSGQYQTPPATCA